MVHSKQIFTFSIGWQDGRSYFNIEWSKRIERKSQMK